eukprot:scaffold5364_cov164-Amphora_coffeaeformis.AAC.33
MDRRLYRMERSSPRVIGGDNDGYAVFHYPQPNTADINNHNEVRPTAERQCYTWTKIPTLNGNVPPPRSGAASVVTRHPTTGAARLWVLAGYGGNVSRLDDFYYYDFSTGLWEIVNVLSQEKPGPRENNGVVLSDSRSQSIYLFGGVSEKETRKYGFFRARWTCLQESSDPDPAIEDAMGGVGRGGGSLAAQNRRVAPSRRFGYVSVVHEGKFLLFGGFDGTRWLNDMFVFDFETNKWTEVEPRGDLPSVRSCPAWAKDDRYVYVLGGYDGIERKNDFFACDLTTYSWTQMPCLGSAPSPRYFHSCCLYAGKLFLYGGYSGTERLSDMFSYDFDTNHWSTIDCTAGDAPSGRSSLVAQVYDNSLYVFGGYNGQTVLNDFYKFRLKPVSVPPTSLVRDMSRLLQQPELADVCFRVESCLVYANRAILAIRSEYFRVMLCGGMRESHNDRRRFQRSPSANHMETEGFDDEIQNAEQPHGNLTEIDLPDVPYDVFMKVLEYLYTDSVQDVSLELGIQLLVASEQFMLDRLKSLCEDLIRHDIDVNNVLGILVAAHRHNASCLKGIALDFVILHLNETTIMTGLSELRQEPDLLLEIIKRNAGNQPMAPAHGGSARVVSSGGPFGQGAEWSAGARR